MLFLDELEPLVGQTPKVAEFGSKSTTGNAQSADAGNEHEAYDARYHLDEVISHARSPRDNQTYRAALGVRTGQPEDRETASCRGLFGKNCRKGHVRNRPN